MASHPEPSLKWKIDRQPGFTTVEFTGVIDEEADFNELVSCLDGRVVFHLAGVMHVNSFGARGWIRFLRELQRVEELTMIHCSPVVVAQFNMIHDFHGKGRVRSFFARYSCSRCQGEELRLLHWPEDFPGDGTRIPPVFACSCGGRMEFDENVERYLAFL